MATRPNRLWAFDDTQIPNKFRCNKCKAVRYSADPEPKPCDEDGCGGMLKPTFKRKIWE